MIQKDFFAVRADGVNLYRSYSDKGLQILKVGTDEIYDEAIDVEGAPYTYEEIDVPSEDATEADYQYALREMGVAV